MSSMDAIEQMLETFKEKIIEDYKAELAKQIKDLPVRDGWSEALEDDQHTCVGVKNHDLITRDDVLALIEPKLLVDRELIDKSLWC